MESAAPRSCAASACEISRPGDGSLTRVPAALAGSAPKLTWTSSRSAMARNAAAVERLKISVGLSLLLLIQRSHQRRLDAALHQLGAKAALVVLGHRGALDLVAFVQEGDPEGEGDVVE